jgi:hypothetical protein
MSNKNVMIQVFNDFQLPNKPLALAVDNLNQIRPALSVNQIVSDLNTPKHKFNQVYGNVFTLTFKTRNTIGMVLFIKSGKALELTPAKAKLSTLVPYRWLITHIQILKKYGHISIDPRHVSGDWWIAATKHTLDIAIAEYELWKVIFRIQEVKDRLDGYINAEDAWESTQREWVIEDYEDFLLQIGIDSVRDRWRVRLNSLSDKINNAQGDKERENPFNPSVSQLFLDEIDIKTVNAPINLEINPIKFTARSLLIDLCLMLEKTSYHSSIRINRSEERRKQFRQFNQKWHDYLEALKGYQYFINNGFEYKGKRFKPISLVVKGGYVIGRGRNGKKIKFKIPLRQVFHSGRGRKKQNNSYLLTVSRLFT